MEIVIGVLLVLILLGLVVNVLTFLDNNSYKDMVHNRLPLMEDDITHIRSYVDDKVREKEEAMELVGDAMNMDTPQEEEDHDLESLPPIEGDTLEDYIEKADAHTPMIQEFPDQVYRRCMADCFYRMIVSSRKGE